MRMDDCIPAVSPIDAEQTPAAAEQRSAGGGLRFTSNVVGSLFVVTDIEVTSDKKPKASGGQVRILDPWNVAAVDLTPKVFEYRLPA